MPGENKGTRYKKRKKAKGRFSRVMISVFIVIAVMLICFAAIVVVGIELGKKADQYAAESQYDLDYEYVNFRDLDIVNTQLIAE